MDTDVPTVEQYFLANPLCDFGYAGSNVVHCSWKTCSYLKISLNSI